MIARYKWLGPIVVLLPVAFAVFWVLRYNPTDGTVGPLGYCTWHMIFGFNGPGCGATRAFWYLLHGNLLRALQYHLPLVITVPFLGYAWVQWFLVNMTGTALPPFRPKRWHLIAFGVGWVLWTIVRNYVNWLNIPNMAG